MQASCMSDAPASRLSRKKRLRVCPRSPEGGGTVGNSQFEVKEALRCGRLYKAAAGKETPARGSLTRRPRRGKVGNRFPPGLACEASSLPRLRSACRQASLLTESAAL